MLTSFNYQLLSTIRYTKSIFCIEAIIPCLRIWPSAFTSSIVTIKQFIYRFTFYLIEREPVDEFVDGDNQ